MFILFIDYLLTQVNIYLNLNILQVSFQIKFSTQKYL